MYWICSHIHQEQVYTLVTHSDILLLTFIHATKNYKVSTCCIRWVTIHSDYLLNNMPFKRDNILKKRQRKTLLVTVNNWTKSDSHLIGVVKCVLLLLNTTNGHNGFSTNCLIHGTTTIPIKRKLSLIWWQSSKRKEMLM